MAINWFKNHSNLTAKVSKNNIILNKSCSKFLNEYAYCIIGYNHENSNIVISPIDYSMIDNKEVDYTLFKINTTRTYSRIACTDFISEISNAFQLNFTKEKKYITNYNVGDNMLEIDLKSEVNQ